MALSVTAMLGALAGAALTLSDPALVGSDTLAPRILLPASGEVLLYARVVDAERGTPIPCRVYLSDPSGQWYFPKSAVGEGTALPYSRVHGKTASVEHHTTVSAHPFFISLPPGLYTLRVERGKEYAPLVRQIRLEKPGTRVELELKLQAWIRMEEKGWFSGETHVHHGLSELPLLMEAEQLHMTFPLTWWVRTAYQPPLLSEPETPVPVPERIQAGPNSWILPRNTEYEIFTVQGTQHVLGAFFVLNHKAPLTKGAPPVQDIAEQAHAEGALIDLDKHAWEWSMMLVPVMRVDLYELANNHLWRTEFGFPNWGAPAPAYMRLEEGGTEWAWIDYGFQNYYALLNCGFRLQPTAGTASGVHPVPLGFGRVYVRPSGPMSPESWLEGLRQGRSFVTTGPMLLAQVNGQDPGHRFAVTGRSARAHVEAEMRSLHPPRKIQLVVNGEVVQEWAPAGKRRGAHHLSRVEATLDLRESAWVAVRVFEAMPDGRLRFAHTAPWHFDLPRAPLRPRKEEVAFLKKRVADEYARNQSVLPPEALEEFRKALHFYEELGKTAR